MADSADLEQLATRLEQSGDYRILRRVPVVTRYTDDDPATVKRLGLLSQFGFFFDDHRAMADCRAVLHLLSLTLPHSGRPILPLLLATARRRTFRLWAHEAPIEFKDLLKERGYRWNSGSDGRPRAWYCDLDRELIVEEELFLAEKVYSGACRHELIRIDYSNRFSDRV
jgi:DNA polymerase III subunit epsilon